MYPGAEYCRLPVNGIEMNVMLAGDGEQAQALVAAGNRVIAPDTRGCGESGIPGRVAD